MGNIQTTVLIIHTFIALAIIGLVLVQRGKGADAGAAFGAGASGTVFGARGSSSFFSRATAVLAAAFFATSLTLAYLSAQHSSAPDSLLESAPAAEAEQAEPAVPPTVLPELEDAEPEAEAPGLPSLDEEEAVDAPDSE
jgi:preprotein translocase subunit SecG